MHFFFFWPNKGFVSFKEITEIRMYDILKKIVPCNFEVAHRNLLIQVNYLCTYRLIILLDLGISILCNVYALEKRS